MTITKPTLATAAVAAAVLGLAGLTATKNAPPGQPPSQSAPVEATGGPESRESDPPGVIAPPDFGARQTVRGDGMHIEPDPVLTPGAILTTDPAVVSKPGYAKSVRSVTEETKQAAYRRYNVIPTAGQHFEVDHLISLELGGSNDIENLWPEPYWGDWNAHQKDALENRLHNLVAAGRMSLPDAQTAIRSDWIAAYGKYCPTKGGEALGNHP